MSVKGAVLNQLHRRAPRLDDRLQVATWRRRNRERAVEPELSPQLSAVVERLRRDGLVITGVDTVFGDRALFEEAGAKVRELHDRPREKHDAAAGSKATFLTKLATGSYDAADPFVRLALHPSALAVANAYLGLRSTLRALDLWLTEPTPGPAIQTQLWHRDGDDVVNVKMFVYFTDVTPEAGPITFAPRTHPFGDRRTLPEYDEQARSTDEQLTEIVPESEWVLCTGAPGTVVFGDTCGYHKQTKPTGAERVKLVAHYVSGTPFVRSELELRCVDADALSDDQYVAVFDRQRG